MLLEKGRNITHPAVVVVVPIIGVSMVQLSGPTDVVVVTVW